MLDAMALGMGLERPALRHSRNVPAHCGNVVSVTVLHALRDTLPTLLSREVGVSCSRWAPDSLM
jgi:predicted naringenin-chalcone synthase